MLVKFILIMFKEDFWMIFGKMQEFAYLLTQLVGKYGFICSLSGF